MYLSKAQEKILDGLREKVTADELDSIQKYGGLKENGLDVGSGLYHMLEDILEKNKPGLDEEK
jgi:hypothetical protein